jgi:multidrug efflux system membrane fusion protein
MNVCFVNDEVRAQRPSSSRVGGSRVIGTQLSSKAVAAFGIATLVLLLLGACSQEEEGGNEFWKKPVSVRVAVAQRETLPVILNVLGTVTPMSTVTVRSRIDGELVRVRFEEGQYVEEGTLLAEIDPRPYQVALAQAEGLQQQNLVELRNAESELQRFEELYAKKFIPRQQVTNQEALVMGYRARLKTDQANVDNARLQLSYTQLTAPVSGRLGLRKVDRGNLIRSNDAEGLVTITQMKPIAVMFTIPETEVPAVMKAIAEETKPQVQAWDRNQRELLATGVLTSADNSIDTATGTLRLRATFTNEDGSLFPNQFVNARVHVSDIEDAVVIPNASVQYGSQGNYVFAVGDDNKAQIRPVVLGAADGERVAVLQGLLPGERIVLEGLDRLRDGKEVEVVASEEDAEELTDTAPTRESNT